MRGLCMVTNFIDEIPADLGDVAAQIASLQNTIETSVNKIVAALLAQHSVEVSEAAMNCYRKVLKELEGGR